MRMRRFIAPLAGLATLLGMGVVAAVLASPASGETGTLFGASVRRMPDENFAQGLANRDAEYGRLNVVRVFFPGDPGDWSSSRLNVDRPVHVSFKADADDINTGALDDMYRAWFASAPTDHQIWWTYYHEPEDNIANGEFTAAAYRQAWRRIWSISQEPGVAKDNVASALVLMDWTVDPRSGRDWRDYYPGPEYVDVMAWDIYNFGERDDDPRNDETMAEHQQRRPTLEITRSIGKPYAIAELGYNDPATRPQFLRETAIWARDNDVLYVTYFDSTGSLGDHRLLDAPSQQAWREVVTGALFDEDTGEPPASEPAGESGTPAVTTTATTGVVEWRNQIDPAGGTWYAACASWSTASSGWFEEAPAAERLRVSGAPAELVCTRSGLPSGMELAVRVKLYDADGNLRHKSEPVRVTVP